MKLRIVILGFLAALTAAGLRAHQLENTLSFLDLDRMADVVAIAECTQPAGPDNGESFRVIETLRTVQGLDVKTGQQITCPPPLLFLHHQSQYRTGVSLVFLRHSMGAWYALRGPFLARNSSLKEWKQQLQVPFLNHTVSPAQAREALAKHVSLIAARPSVFPDPATAEAVANLRKEYPRQQLGDERPAVYARWLASGNPLLQLSALADAVQVAELFPLPPQIAAGAPADFSIVRDRVTCPPEVRRALQQLAFDALKSGDIYLHSAGLALVERIGIPQGLADTFLDVIGRDEELLVVRQEAARYFGLCPEVNEAHVARFAAFSSIAPLNDRQTDYLYEGLKALVNQRQDLRTFLEGEGLKALAGETEDDLKRGLLLLSAAGTHAAYQRLDALVEEEEAQYRNDIVAARRRIVDHSLDPNLFTQLMLTAMADKPSTDYTITPERAARCDDAAVTQLLAAARTVDVAKASSKARLIALMTRMLFDPSEGALQAVLKQGTADLRQLRAFLPIALQIRTMRGLPNTLSLAEAALLDPGFIGRFGLIHQDDAPFRYTCDPASVPKDPQAKVSFAEAAIAAEALGFNNEAWNRKLHQVLNAMKPTPGFTDPTTSASQINDTLTLVVLDLRLHHHAPDTYPLVYASVDWIGPDQAAIAALAKRNGLPFANEASDQNRLAADATLRQQVALSGGASADRDLLLHDPAMIPLLFKLAAEGDADLLGLFTLDRRCGKWFGGTSDLDASGKAEVIRRIEVWREKQGEVLAWDEEERHIVAVRISTKD